MIMILEVVLLLILVSLIPSSLSLITSSPLLSSLSSLSSLSLFELKYSNSNYNYNSNIRSNSNSIRSSSSSSSSMIRDSKGKTFTPNRDKANIVFVGNLPFTINDEIVIDMIQSTFGDAKGMIKKIQIAKGKKSDRPLGYMFLHFNTFKMAQDACAYFHGLDYDGRTLNANMKDNDEPSKFNKNCPKRITQSIFLRNLDYSMTENEIVNMCDDILGPGLVQFVKIPLDKYTKVPKGYAHIQFKDMETVNRAVIEFTGLEVFGRALTAEKLKAPREFEKKVAVPVEEEFYSDNDEYPDYSDSYNGMV